MTTNRHRIQRRRPMQTRDVGDERHYVMTDPPVGAPPDAEFSTIKIDITRYAERVFAMDDATLERPGGFGRIVTDEDMAAVQTTAELAAFLTTIYGSEGGRGKRAMMDELRMVVSAVESFRRFLAAMREESAAQPPVGKGERR